MTETPKILFYTNAYNAQSTLSRTIESILAQTHGDWLWYLVDNGSSDATGAMIREAAQRESRIIPLANRQNHVIEPGNGWWELSRHEASDFLCFIDADDEYKPEFIEKTLAFAEKNQLDIACCGNDFINWQTGKSTSARVLPSDLLIEGTGFSRHFVRYHPFMRTLWGKLYRLHVIRRTDLARAPKIYYSWDTLFAQECFRQATCVGILAQSLHKYHVRPHSSSTQWHTWRIEADTLLLKFARDFLTDKYGSVTPENEDFLLIVYMNAIMDSLDVLFKSNASGGEKLGAILAIFSHEYTRQLAAHENLGSAIGDVKTCAERRRGLFSMIADCLLKIGEVPNEHLEWFCDVGEFVCAACEYADGWIFFKKRRARFLLESGRSDEARPALEELAQWLPADEEIAHLCALLQ